LRIQYLGTAASEGWPALFCRCDACREAARRGGKNIRRRSGALINGNILLDFSPDLYFARIALSLDLGAVRAAVITHGHPDHFYPENADLRMPVFAYGYATEPFRLFGSAHTAQLYSHHYPQGSGRPPADFPEFVTVAPYESFDVCGVHFTALPAAHGCPGSFIYLLEEGSNALLYAHDTGLWTEPVWDFLASRRLSAVSLDCTFGPQPCTYPGHMGFDENILIRRRMLQSGIAPASARFISSHFSHNASMPHEEMAELMRPQGFIIAYDGMELAL
jgi:phosphoribosyl 1,2-cyclic phosphate phosphodiesterase